MNDEDFELLNNLMETECGIHFERSRSYLLEQPLMQRMKKRNITSFQSYYYELINPLNGVQELNELIPLITIGETYFFRNSNHIQTLTNYIIPTLIKNKQDLSILSAGCSTGEEPYTISMLLKEYFPFVNYKIIATDIDQTAIEKAKQGLYQQRALMKTSKNFINKYFLKQGNGYQIKPEIKNRVIFQKNNLIDELFYQTTGLFDLIICRNVLIYFSIPVIKKIIEKFRSIIVPSSIDKYSKMFKLLMLTTLGTLQCPLFP